MRQANPYNPWQVNIGLFFGRQDLLRDLLADIKAGRSSAVCGGRRMGKTMLLRVLEAKTQADFHEPESGQLILTAYVDLAAINLKSGPGPIYEAIYQHIAGPLIQLGLLEDAWESQASTFKDQIGVENAVFADLYGKIVELVEPTCFLRTVVIFDEIEPLVNSEWSDGFFSNWRYMLNNAPRISRNLSVIFAGAKEMAALYRDIGSPIGNILTWRSMELLPWRDSRQLIHEPTGNKINERIARRVYLLSGGHPFLMQYLLHHLVERSDYSFGSLDEIASELVHIHGQQFQNWAEKLNDQDKAVFAYMLQCKTWVAKREIVNLVGDSAGNEAVSILSQTGIISKRPGAAEQYRIAGTLFADWFEHHYEPKVPIPQRACSRWVITIHGIRTRGVWQKELTDCLNGAELRHVPFDYGFFNVLELIFPPSRHRVLKRFLEHYSNHVAKRGARPSVIGHSFGAYIICQALEKYPEIEFDQIILCGSISDAGYPWSSRIPVQVSRVLNDFGRRDFWARLAGWFIRDAGASGTDGFSDTAGGLVIQRAHSGFHHSDYFYNLNYQMNWIPFLQGLDLKPVEALETPRKNTRFRITMWCLVVFLAALTVMLLIHFLR